MKRSSTSSRKNTLHDAEVGHGKLQQVRTDEDYRPGSADQRSAEFGAPGPRKAGSTPVNSRAVGKDDSNEYGIERTMSPDADEINGTDGMLSSGALQHEDSKHTMGSETLGSVPEERTPSYRETNGSTEKTPDVEGEEGARHRKLGGLKDKLHHHKEEKQEEKSIDSTSDDHSKREKPNFTFASQIRATLFNSWINVLLILSPVGIAVYYAHVAPVAVFVINFIAIIPLAAMLSYATEEIALRTGETLGGLLNATFGNAVELIVSIIALTQHQTLIVQTSLIGSMLSNLLLVMGMCFFFGGFNRIEQAFNVTVAQTAASLLALAVGSLIIPTAFHSFAPGGQDAGILQLSRGTAILLLLVYGCYLFFQLKSHADMYNAPSEKNAKKAKSVKSQKMKNKLRRGKNKKDIVEPNNQKGRVPKGTEAPGPNGAGADDREEEGEQPQLHIWVAILTLGLSTILVALNAEYLVDSINEITCTTGFSKTFVGLILLPIVGNAAEHATAVTVAVKDKMDLAIGVAVGSSMQIALLVLPFVVVLGWIIDPNTPFNAPKPPMTLYFGGFEIAILFVAVILVNYIIQDGKSHWLEGVMLMIFYTIIAIAA